MNGPDTTRPWAVNVFRGFDTRAGWSTGMGLERRVIDNLSAYGEGRIFDAGGVGAEVGLRWRF